MDTRTRRYWGTQRVARVCQVTPATVAHWIDQGHLKGHRTPTGHRRVESTDLVAFLNGHGMPVPPDRASNGHKETVAVVDDDADYRQLLVRHLMLGGVTEVTAAATGMDGLLEIGRVRPSVVVLDFSLPDLNAVEVVERLLAPGGGHGLGAEVVVATGGVTDQEQARLRGLGVQTIMNKEAGFEAVVDVVRQALQRRRSAVA